MTPAARFRKLARYLRLYGPRRTLAKVRAARHMERRVDAPSGPRGRATDVGFIGCGRFAFSTLAYYLQRDFGWRVRRVMDVDPARAASFARAYGAMASEDADDVINDEAIRLVFVASNHASHADYAVRCLEAGKSVHVEKPPAVDRAQLEALCASAQNSVGTVTLGFNRPHSPLGATCLAALHAEKGPSAQTWFVAGHQIGPDHWYRNPGEGGRVLGNLCHWIDFSLRVVPEEHCLPLTIVPVLGLAPASLEVTYVFGDGSTASLTLASFGEPFEGVRERYTAQRGDTLVALDDFETLRIDCVASKVRRSGMFRDHGHRATVRRSVRAAAGEIEGDTPAFVWRTGILSIWTHEAVARGAKLVADTWMGTPRYSALRFRGGAS